MLAEALKESDRHKTDFLASLSHELRNPLAAIHDSLLVLAQAPPESEPARNAREVQQRQIDHLVRLVDELLDVTRISRGKITLKRSRIELRDLVERTCEDHRAIFHRRLIALGSSSRTTPSGWTPTRRASRRCSERELGRVLEQVPEHLRDARLVGVQPDGLVRELEPERDQAPVEDGAVVLAGALHQVAQLDPRALQGDFPREMRVTSSSSSTSRTR